MFARLLTSPHLLWSLIALTSLVHLLVAIQTPLSVDEAHYALYGLSLDWSYFDHPPLVGWLQAIILTWLGDAEWQLRLWAIFSYALSLYLLHQYTLYLQQPLASANLVALLFSLMPIVHLLGIGLVPDTLLLPIAIALIWQAQKTLQQPTWLNWSFVGLLLGLAALSKYTSLLFAFGLLLLLFNRQQIHWLWQAKFWLAIVIAALLSLPILWWNWQHDWISIHYQLNHGRPDKAFDWLHLWQSQGAQLLLYLPTVWLLAWWFILRPQHWWSNLAQRQLVLFMLPALAVFVVSSGKEPSLPHWLAFFYVLSLPLISQQLVNQQGQLSYKKTTIITVGYGFILISILVLLTLQPKLSSGLEPNPTQDLIGWKPAAQQAQQLAQDNEILLVPNWVDASRIAWYARPLAVVVLDRRYDQFDIWYGSPTADTQGLLILSPEQRQKGWQRYFQQCDWLADSDEQFQFYRCHGYQLR